MQLLLSIGYLICTSLGLLFMKLGGDSLSLTFKSGIQFQIGFLTCLGFFFYIGSFLIWQKLLVSFDLSFIFPILTGIVQIIVLLIGIIVFKENCSIINVLGIIFVIIGIGLLTR